MHELQRARLHVVEKRIPPQAQKITARDLQYAVLAPEGQITELYAVAFGGGWATVYGIVR